jgi:hypothetical protein
MDIKNSSLYPHNSDSDRIRYGNYPHHFHPSRRGGAEVARVPPKPGGGRSPVGSGCGGVTRANELASAAVVDDGRGGGSPPEPGRRRRYGEKWWRRQQRRC